MRATDLAELAAFEAVSRHLSFRRAGEERGVTASAISHAVSNLEARVGVRLLNRTTRSVSLTDAGARLQTEISPAFASMTGAVDALNQFRDTPFGKIRINVPNSIAPFVLGHVIGPLAAANPNLQIEVVATDRLVDIVDEGFDAGIRLGESLHESMIAVRIKPRLRLIVVGAPGYYKHYGKPKTPRDLSKHVCIRNMYPNGAHYPWEFERDGATIAYQPSGPISLDDHELMVQTALSGVALAYVWEQRAERNIAEGRLIQCLDGWCPPEDWLYLYYPSRRNLPAGVRALIKSIEA